MSIIRKFGNFIKTILDLIFKLDKLDNQKKDINAQIGSKGEQEVAKVLSTLGRKYKVYNDIYIPKNKNSDAQVDHLVISNKGIVVIETKTYGGKLEGKVDANHWKHTNSGNKTYDIYNPIKQNEGHVRAVSKYLDVPESMITNIVVFNGNVDYRTIKSNHLVHINDLCSKIANLPAYDYKQYHEDKSKLAQIKDNKYIRERHLKQVKEITTIDFGKCPLCGNKLVKRYSNRGEFIGCSGYPKCNYIGGK